MITKKERLIYTPYLIADAIRKHGIIKPIRNFTHFRSCLVEFTDNNHRYISLYYNKVNNSTTCTTLTQDIKKWKY